MDCRMIPMDQLVKCPIQFRPVRKETVEYQQLLDSIRDEGILTSICVRPSKIFPGKFEVCFGFNRHSCAEDLRLIEVPCTIRNMDDAKVRQLQLEENLQRIHVDSVDVARRLWRIIHIDKTKTLPELARGLHMSSRVLRERLKLVQLCPEAEIMLTENQLSLGMACELAKLPHQDQVRLLSVTGGEPNGENLDLIRSEARHYRQRQKNDRVAQRLQDTYDVRPTFRDRKELLHELVEPTMMASVYEACEARTPSDYWKACLRFVFRVDPETYEKRKSEN